MALGADIRISVDERPMRDALLRLAADVERGAGLRSVWTAIGVDLGALVQREFTEASAGRGAAWRPLGLLTRLFRRGRKVETLAGLGEKEVKILADTGLLRTSLRGRGPGGVFDVGALHVEVGTQLSYAERHHFGSTSAVTYAAEGKDDVSRRFAGSPNKVLLSERMHRVLKTARVAFGRAVAPGTTRRSKGKVHPGGRPRGNPDFYVLRRALLRRGTTTITVPPRPLIAEDFALRHEGRVLTLLERGLDRLLGAGE